MSTSPIVPISAVPQDVAPATVPPPAPVSSSTTTSATTPPTPNLNPEDFQLLIEDDKAAGSFVYKTINRHTGEIVSQFPRDEILKLREAFHYVAGGVISTKA